MLGVQGAPKIERPKTARTSSTLRSLCLLLLAFMLQAAHAAHEVTPLDDYFKEVWTTRDGLPHNLVHNVVQTPDGYLWFATWEGVARYNGREFRVFDRGTVPELNDNGVRSLRLARDGGLWLGTSRGGVSRYRNGQWRTLTRKDGLAQDEIMDLLEDREGRLWVATESAGISRVESDRVSQFQRDAGLPSDVMYQLLEDDGGRIWAATAEGLARFDGVRFVALGPDQGLPAGQVFSLAKGAGDALYVGTEIGVYRRQGDRFELLDDDLPHDNIGRLLVDAAGSIWVGTVNGGLYRYHDGRVEQVSSLRGLPNNRVSSLFQDREGSLWVGTNAGLLRLRDAPFTTFTSEDGLPDDYVRSVMADAGGTLWIGTSRGLGYYRDGRFGRLTREDGLPGDSVLSLAGSKDGTLWIGTYSHGAVKWKDGVQRVIDGTSGLLGNQVRALLEARDGLLWIGTTRGLGRLDANGLRVFTVADGMPRDFVISLHEAQSGRIFVGTANGLAEVSGNRVIKHSLAAMDDAQDVFGFSETEDGTLWLATDRGLVRRRDERMTLIGRQHGLPVDTVFQILDDTTGYFWLTSNRGILRVARSDLDAAADGLKPRAVFEWYGEADGMASAQNNGGSGPVAWRTADGKLWFGTARGVSMTEPHRLQGLVRAAPPVVIEEVRVDDRHVPLGETVTLAPGARKLEMHFAGLSYIMPHKIQYRYRLDGFDANWVERGTLRFAQFTNLAPGDYEFRVAAANPGGEWSEQEARVRVRVEPLMVQRREFWWLLAVGAMFVLYGLYRWRVHRLEYAQRQLRDLVDRRTADLRGQTERLTATDQEKTLLLDRLRTQSEAFERQAREDGLTGLMNRRCFDEALAREFAHAQRTGRPLAVALADLDHFKRLNDGYSHAAGDAALKAVAELMRATCRSMDVTARWGGEEFALLFPETTREEAQRVCERLRLAVERYDCAAFAPGYRLTISIGITDQTGLSHHERMISRADAKLYEAKDAGRNRVCI